MSGLLLCGKTTDRPFYVKEAELNVYSMEELCYFIYNNVYMIGQDFFDDSLLKFIEDELELINTVKKLKDQRFRQEPAASMIKTVLDGCSYYSEAEKESLLNELKGLENMSLWEKMKMRADLMAEGGRLNRAEELYKKAISKVSLMKDTNLTASLWNNLGVVHAKQFLFSEALSCFKRAYDMVKDDEYRINFVSMAILMNNEESLEDIMTQYQITEDVIERHRYAIQLAQKETGEEKRVHKIMEKLTYGSDMELSEFYKNSDDIIDIWKKEYREQIR